MTLTLDVKLTPEQIAEAWCDLDDEGQAQFFIECARIAAKWRPDSNFQQWFSIGRHLRDCECSTEEARGMVRDIAAPLMVSP